MHLDRELTSVPESVIISSNYPNNYDLNSQCAATVKFEQNKNIVLYFLDFNVQGDTECSKDYLEVSSGTKENRTILKRLCGPTIPAPIALNDSTTYLFFNSDNSSSETGYFIYPAKGNLYFDHNRPLIFVQITHNSLVNFRNLIF